MINYCYAEKAKTPSKENQIGAMSRADPQKEPKESDQHECDSIRKDSRNVYSAGKEVEKETSREKWVNRSQTIAKLFGLPFFILKSYSIFFKMISLIIINILRYKDTLTSKLGLSVGCVLLGYYLFVGFYLTKHIRHIWALIVARKQELQQQAVVAARLGQPKPEKLAQLESDESEYSSDEAIKKTVKKELLLTEFVTLDGSRLDCLFECNKLPRLQWMMYEPLVFMARGLLMHLTMFVFESYGVVQVVLAFTWELVYVIYLLVTRPKHSRLENLMDACSPVLNLLYIGLRLVSFAGISHHLKQEVIGLLMSLLILINLMAHFLYIVIPVLVILWDLSKKGYKYLKERRATNKVEPDPLPAPIGKVASKQSGAIPTKPSVKKITVAKVVVPDRRGNGEQVDWMLQKNKVKNVRISSRPDFVSIIPHSN